VQQPDVNSIECIGAPSGDCVFADSRALCRIKLLARETLGLLSELSFQSIETTKTFVFFIQLFDLILAASPRRLQ